MKAQMTKKEKFYCKLGQAVEEGIQMLGLAMFFAGILVYGIMR